MRAVAYYDWKTDSVRLALGGKKPLRGSKQQCGAHARSTGEPCIARALKNGRCRNHGGMSTGPKTAAGKARALANLKQYQILPF